MPAVAGELHDAAEAGDTDEIIRLIKAGSDVNATNGFGMVPLTSATMLGHTETVRALIEQGADVDATGEMGMTPLAFATILGHTEIARILTEQGADVKAVDEIMSAFTAEQLRDIRQLQDAAKAGNDDEATLESLLRLLQ